MFDFIDDCPGEEAVYSQQGLYIPEATDCMRCGLCISVCPTYKLFQSEAETPRSRLRSIDKIIHQTVSISDEELHHLNNCTQCRACETLVSTNIGCALHLNAGLALNKIVHPVVLLAELLT